MPATVVEGAQASSLPATVSAERDTMIWVLTDWSKVSGEMAYIEADSVDRAKAALTAFFERNSIGHMFDIPADQWTCREASRPLCVVQFRD